MTDKKEIKKYCSGIDCLTCGEAEPCIYRIANELQEQLKRREQEYEELKKQIKNKEQEINKYKQALDEIEKYCKECNLKADFTACDILGFINIVKDN